MLRQLPNIITLSRLVFLAAIAVLAFEHWTGCATLVFFLSLIACITDWLDGFIARRYGFVTNFGKLMDAITDKFFVIGLFIVILLVDSRHHGPARSGHHRHAHDRRAQGRCSLCGHDGQAQDHLAVRVDLRALRSPDVRA
jgi:hypothetical protein